MSTVRWYFFKVYLKCIEKLLNKITKVNETLLVRNTARLPESCVKKDRCCTNVKKIDNSSFILEKKREIFVALIKLKN